MDEFLPEVCKEMPEVPGRLWNKSLHAIMGSSWYLDVELAAAGFLTQMNFSAAEDTTFRLNIDAVSGPLFSSFSLELRPPCLLR